MKYCAACSESISQRRTWCVPCGILAEKASKKKYKTKNKEYFKNQRRIYYLDNYIKEMLRNAKRRGLAYDLTEEDIKIPEYCPILNIKLEIGLDKIEETSPSLDKIIPDLGYIKSNIQIISNKANIMKSNATPEELCLFADWVNKEIRPLLETQ